MEQGPGPVWRKMMMHLRIWYKPASEAKRRARKRREDFVGRLFLVCCAIGLAAGALWYEGFHLGQHSGGPRGVLITRNDDPIVFWFVVVGLSAMGMGMAAYGAWRFFRDREMSDDSR